MAKFTLDLAHVKALLDPPSATPPDWVPFVSGIDPDVRWFIASEKKDPARKTGVYVRLSRSSLGNVLIGAPRTSRAGRRRWPNH
jgi:hypothetical protein